MLEEGENNITITSDFSIIGNIIAFFFGITTGKTRARSVIFRSLIFLHWKLIL